MSSFSASTACQGTPALYRPRRPERTLLHGLAREHLETYLSLAQQGGSEIGAPPVSPSRAPPEEEFDFGPEDDAEAGFDFHQDRPREKKFDFDQRTDCMGREDVSKDLRASGTRKESVDRRWSRW